MNTVKVNKGGTSQDRKFLTIIAVLSVVVPALVAILFYMPKDGVPEADVSYLPTLHAILNSLTAIALLTGYYFIKQRNHKMHRAAMLVAFGLSAVFLISYVTYHFLSESTHFGGEGFIRYVYFFILLTHIVLAAAIVPLVLLSVYFGITEQHTRHRKISKWTFPLWLYVAITGVVVYLMISPYYATA